MQKKFQKRFGAREKKLGLQENSRKIVALKKNIQKNS